jgi:type IV pilus assembly protein PilA
MRKHQKGFSLIELLIVVAIILIIAALSIPSMMRAKMAANEASAVAALRTINTACITYAATYAVGYPVALANLAPASSATSTAADLLDNVLGTGTKSGYNFVLAGGNADAFGNLTTYTANADPVTQDTTGIRHFFTDQSAVIRQAIGAPATVTDTPIGN